MERAGDTRGQDPVVAIQSNSGDAAFCLTASAQQSLDAETETLVAHTLRGEGFDATEDGSGRGTPLVAFSVKDDGSDAGSVALTLRAMNHAGSHANAGGQAAVAFDLRGREGGAMLEGPHDTASVRSAEGGSSRSYVAASVARWAVRRLMPVECERLQGFPDGYTDVPYRGKNTVADGPRYKAIGNSMATNAMEWLGQRIDLVEAILNDQHN